MNIDEFTTCIDRYGSQLQRWPAKLQAEAQTLLESSPRAQALYSRQQSLDALLDQMSTVEFTGLIDRVATQPLPPRRDSLTVRIINWLLPDQSREIWKPALAACLPLLFGVLLGNYFSFGVPYQQAVVADWDTEFYMLALDDYDEAPSLLFFIGHLLK